ncbi:50S ribosomal protein L10 [Haliangium sp. UPWRP_2]|uniref:50S ribosomal protein L10 n=1 Tax=Haliangium sp. UPWRP_2 TaxID=1931276 RepID=UPI000B5449C4|nr:50S ribosomal protein L10 [Haliangium sp. UPWRP_2]PSM30652.1 50S ribosomal protein L10 [Haliangium sp. UPWRP_2]
MNRDEKAQQIAELKEKLQKSAAIVLADYRGLTVPAVTALREEFRKQQCEYKIYKNTLVKLAIKGTPMEKMGKYLEGPTALIYSWDSPSAAAKIAREFAKGNEKFKVKGGYLEGNVLDEKGVSASADMPGKDELRATLLATFVAPATNLVRTLNAGAQNFAFVVDARKRQLEAQG